MSDRPLGLDRTTVDAVAIKPSETPLDAVPSLPIDSIVVDWEGRAHFPSPETIGVLSDAVDLRVTVSVRADGFDPLGRDHGYDRLPADLGFVLVAGHPAYLDPTERARSIAPRLTRAVERVAEPWVGTEGIEAIARGTGATQFELLGPGIGDRVARLRAAGFDGSIAVYAPTVLSTDPDEILAAAGEYVERRPPVADALRTDGCRREVLLDACENWALVGSPGAVRDQVAALRSVGADYVVGYPAGGLDRWVEHGV